MDFIEIISVLSQNSVAIIFIVFIVFFLKALNSIHTTELELLLMERKESDKIRMQGRALIILLFTAEGAGLNFFSNSFIEDILSMAIMDRIIMIVILLAIAVWLVWQNEKDKRLAISMYLIILLSEMIISYNAKNSQTSGIVPFVIIPLVGSFMINFFMEVLKTPIFMKESVFILEINGKECHVFSRVDDKLLCGNGKTMELSDELRMIKVSDVTSGRYNIKNSKKLTKNGD